MKKAPLFRRFGLLVCVLLALGILSACDANAGGLSNSVASANTAGNAQSFQFSMIASPGIKACLPNASGSVTIVPGDLNDIMTVSVSGLVPNTGYDLFVIQLPNKPFGVAWYQSDVQADSHGNGSAQVRGIFNNETFSVSTGGTTQFAPTHQYHLGLWFNDPQVPFKKGCEPGQKAPIVTPFDGEQHAGIQVLNTANFANNAGPLSRLSN